MRLDVCVVSRAMAKSREKASVLIKNGAVTVNGTVVTKPSFDVGETDEIAVSQTFAFVGRGGYKLEKAIDCFGIDVTGLCCLDIGASTGGFTDCLLFHGAEKVYAVDVGSGQLDASLRADPRVVSLENTDIRTLEPFETDFVSCDVSFISLEKILPAVRNFLRENARAVFLVKPQFEVGRMRLKKGVVRDPKLWESVLKKVVSIASEAGFSVLGLCPSPIRGGDGNTEFLMYLQAGGTVPFSADIRAVVKEASLIKRGESL